MTLFVFIQQFTLTVEKELDGVEVKPNKTVSQTMLLHPIDADVDNDDVSDELLQSF